MATNSYNDGICIFISYSREDAHLRDALVCALKKQPRFQFITSIMYDEERQVSGEKFSEAIRRMMAECDFALVLWTKESKKSRWVEYEATQLCNQEKYIGIIAEDSFSDNEEKKRSVNELPGELSGRDTLFWEYEDVDSPRMPEAFASELSRQMERRVRLQDRIGSTRSVVAAEYDRRWFLMCLGGAVVATAAGLKGTLPEYTETVADLMSRNIRLLAARLTQYSSSQLFSAYSHFDVTGFGGEETEEIIRRAKHTSQCFQREIDRFSGGPAPNGIVVEIDGLTYEIDTRNVHRARALPYMIAAQSLFIHRGEQFAALKDRLFLPSEDWHLAEIVCQNLHCGFRPLSAAVDIEEPGLLDELFDFYIDVERQSDTPLEISSTLLLTLMNMQMRARASGADRIGAWAETRCERLLDSATPRARIFHHAYRSWREILTVTPGGDGHEPFILPEPSLLLLERDRYERMVAHGHSADTSQRSSEVLDAMLVLRAFTNYRKFEDWKGDGVSYEFALRRIAGFFEKADFYRRIERILKQRRELVECAEDPDFTRFCEKLASERSFGGVSREVYPDLTNEAMLDFCSRGFSTHSCISEIEADPQSKRLVEQVSVLDGRDKVVSFIRSLGDNAMSFVEGGTMGGALSWLIFARRRLLRKYGIRLMSSETEALDTAEDAVRRNFLKNDT